MIATVFLLFSCSFYTLIHAEADSKTVRDQAEELEATLRIVKIWSKHKDLQAEFEDEYGKHIESSKKNGNDIAKRMKEGLESVLKNKIHTVEMLYRKAESLRANYTFNPELTLKNTDFYDTKDLKAELEIYDTFSMEIPINKSASAVHVPTDVYKGSKDVLNTIKWTEGLDEQFKQNVQDEPTLLWQYIGTAKGMYRIYPGFKWKTPNDQDLYDNRRRGWYIQGSSSSKDMIILLDLSGSMVGSNIAIARLAAMSLLDTLQENDFVNVVVVYEKIPTILCANSMVKEKKADVIGNCTDQMLQATSKNKKYLKSLIPALEAKGESNVNEGFKKALEVLKKSKNKASQCIQTINFFTDGVEKGDEKKTLEILEKDNKKGPDQDQVRVFSYMTGREKGSSESPLKKFACQNRGHFYRVETLSDVREKVLQYMKVLSRPLVYSNNHPISWTPIYLDWLTYMNVISRPLVLSGERKESWTPIYLDKSGLGLMVTVVAPVFNSTDKGSLLGVVGTDVALPQLQNVVPGYEVGANGYGFAINNNGFIVFHPRLKRGVEPRDLVLTQVEGEELEKVTRDMVNRQTGHQTIGEKRVLTNGGNGNVARLSEKRKYHYFYTPVAGTSFSCAVAIPEESMKNMTIKDLDDILPKELESSNKGETVMVAPWPYCPGMESDVRNSTPVHQPSYPTAEQLRDRAKIADCSDVFKHLLLDARASKEVSRNWNITANDNLVSIFVGTSGGLTRVRHKSSSSPPNFGRDVLNEEFYRRVAGAKKDTVVYFADKNNGTTVITASAPLFFDESVIAAAGVQLKPDIFDATCSKFNGSADCHLIDEDAFIVYSLGEDEEIGKFYGAVSKPILEKLIEKRVFTKLTVEDPQGVCSEDGGEESSAMRLLSPLTSVVAYAHWWTQTVFWFLVQMSAFFSTTNRVVANDEPQTRECVKNRFFYKFNNSSTGFSDKFPCDNCDNEDVEWNVTVAPVKNTNLLLVVNTRRDACGTCSWGNIPLEEEKTGLPPFTPLAYRERPNMTCYKYDANEQENDCSGGSALSPASLLPFVLVALSAAFV